jgi:hypothetical protein
MTEEPINGPVEQNKSNIDWRTLDEAVRSWVVQTHFEKDLENYNKLKESYE